MSPRFQLCGACLGNIPGNTSQHYITPYIMMPCSSHPHLVGVESLLLEGPYLHTKHLTVIRLGYLIFNYLSYVMWEPLIVPSGNSYHTSILLVDFSKYVSYVLGQWLWLSPQCMTFVVLLGGRTDSAHAFHQQSYIVRLICAHCFLVINRWKIKYTSTLAEMFLFNWYH